MSEEKMYKLPYIPDRDLYLAVIGAIRWIRKTGWFNKATQYYADYYNKDVEEVRKIIRGAQSVGQKIAAKKKPRKYHYYVIAVIKDWYGGGEDGLYDSYDWQTEQEIERHIRFGVRKATSAKNAEKAVDPTKDLTFFELMATPHEEHHVIYTKEFLSEDEAQKHKQSLVWEDLRPYVVEYAKKTGNFVNILKIEGTNT